MSTKPINSRIVAQSETSPPPSYDETCFGDNLLRGYACETRADQASQAARETHRIRRQLRAISLRVDLSPTRNSWETRTMRAASLTKYHHNYDKNKWKFPVILSRAQIGSDSSPIA